MSPNFVLKPVRIITAIVYRIEQMKLFLTQF